MILKKLILGATAVSALGLVTATLADNGLYLRGELGYGFPDTPSSRAITIPGGVILPVLPAGATTATQIKVNSSKSDGVTGRVAIGYNINPYFGIESGYSLFSSVYRTLTFTGATNVAGTTQGQTKSTLYAIDLLGKATIPFNQFYAFVDGGAAYVHVKNSALTANLAGTGIQFWNTNSNGYLRPKVGAGIGYNITNNVAIDVSYSRIFGKNGVDKPNFVPNINTATVGLTYKF